MFIGLYLILFLVACFFLARAGAWSVKSLLSIAKFLNWKKFVIASLIMGTVSSLPELFVGIGSSLSGRPELSFGNIIGSNIVLLTLIIGVSVLVGGQIVLKGKALQKSLLFSAFYALLPLLLMMDGRASRADGVILLVSFGFYLKELLSEKDKFKKSLSQRKKTGAEIYKVFFKDLAYFLLAIVIMIASAELIVFSAGRLAVGLDLPLVLIGVLGIALGTSLPELSFSLRAVGMKEKEMVVGGVVGSIAVNSALVLGLTCLISPFRTFSLPLYTNSFIFTGLSVLMFLFFSKTGDRFSRKEAKALLFLYGLFVFVELILG